MRKQQRLRVLHVRGAGHGHAADCVSACAAIARRKQASAPRSSRAASVTYMRNSVATISLRLRPVCSLAPSGPSFSISAVSDEMMNVFGCRSIEPCGVGLRAQGDFVERRDDLLAFFVGENSRCGDGARPGAVEREFLRQQCGDRSCQERSNS